jgi:hypothetical protein
MIPAITEKLKGLSEIKKNKKDITPSDEAIVLGS